jgi:hypothetical protein
MAGWGLIRLTSHGEAECCIKRRTNKQPMHQYPLSGFQTVPARRGVEE